MKTRKSGRQVIEMWISQIEDGEMAGKYVIELTSHGKTIAVLGRGHASASTSMPFDSIEDAERAIVDAFGGGDDGTR